VGGISVTGGAGVGDGTGVGGTGVFVGGTGVFVGGTGVFVGGIGVRVGRTGILVGKGVSVHTIPCGCTVGEGVNNELHKKNFVFVGVKVAVRVKVGVFEEERGVGEDLLGVNVAFP
jgi:hypothetical protein